ncbi:MAG: hypothetical protein HUU02_15900, partial [Bacteroidetes bacterium]|nr:hypothetical protein [Bacteroidota bacterium]
MRLRHILLPLVTVCCAAAQQTAPAAASNQRIYPSPIAQTEVFIVRHPSDPAVLFCSANTINLSSGFISEGVYVSTDAGISWRGNDTCTGAPVAFHKGDPGITIDKDGRFHLVRLSSQDGLYAHVSTDQGKSWSSQRTVGIERQDRATMATDAFPSGTTYGRSYTAYVELLPPFPVKVAWTGDGSTWTPPSAINAPLQRSQGAELSMSAESTLYAVWAGVIPQSPFTEDFIGFARTTNGGVSWTVTENAIDINGVQGVIPQKGNIRVNGLPRMDVDRSNGPRKGWVYLVTGQKGKAPAGNDPDIVFYRSTDRGTTWSSGVRITADPVNNGKVQYFPSIHVDDGGGINILYYDDRNTTSDSVGVYLSRSTDGGNSWNDYPVSDHHFKPQAIGGLGQGYQGDNISLTSVNGMLIPVWMDNVSGVYQIWSSRIPIAGLVSVPNERSLPVDFLLQQNYPNPFNPSTTIRFTLPVSGYAELTVYDLLGREVAVIASGEFEEGTHERVFEAGEGI